MSARALARRTVPLLVLALAACPEGPPPPPPPPPPAPAKVATLTAVEGPVTLTRKGAAPAAAQPGPLFGDDVLATGAKARAVLRTLDGRELELGEDTRFRVSEVLGRVALEVQQGTISIVGEEGGALAIDTRYGRTALSRGAQGTLSVTDKGLAFDVRMGTITLVEEDGGERSAKAGQRLAMAMGAISIEEVEQPAPPDAGVERPAVAPVRFTPEQGAPQLKTPKDKKLRKAKADGEELPPGTAFSVPGGARARLSTDKVAVRLQPGAKGTVGAATEADGQASVAMGLSGGAATLAFPAGASAVDLGPATVRAARPATVAVVKTAKGVTVDVLVGEVDVVAAGKTERLRAGQKAAAGKAGVEVSERGKPVVVLPLGRTSRVYGVQGEVALAVPEGAARVEVATDPAYKDVLLSGEAAEQVVVPAPAAGELHWRAFDTGGAVAQEGHARFRPDSSAGPGGAGSETVSETGLKATLYYQGKLPALTFIFEPKPDAKTYRLKVFRAGDLKTALVERDVTEARCTLEPGALGEGSYVWYAAVLAEGGAELGGGAMNKFDVVYDNQLTTLSITSPAPRQKATADLMATGVAPLKSKLSVNGKVAPLDERGRFSVKVGRVETVTFRLVTADGAESIWIRRLKR